MLECLGLTGAKCLDPERLLAHAEQGADCTRYVLTTGAKSLRNIAMYRSAGYELAAVQDDSAVVRLAKHRPAVVSTI